MKKVPNKPNPSKSKTPNEEQEPIAEPSEWERIKANIKTFGGAILLAVAIRIILFEAFEIEGPSMEPTLLNGDRVVVAKFLYGLFLPFTDSAILTWGTPNPGDVVIVKSPADNIDIVKRVIGRPGDVIEIRRKIIEEDGIERAIEILYRNGKTLPRKELGPCQELNGDHNWAPGCEWVQETVNGRGYLTSHAVDSPVSAPHAIRVPPGHIFILGDHRDRSNDSRFIGPVPVSRVKGRALFVYWSNRDGRLDGVRWTRLGHGVR